MALDFLPPRCCIAGLKGGRLLILLAAKCFPARRQFGVSKSRRIVRSLFTSPRVSAKDLSDGQEDLCRKSPVVDDVGNAGDFVQRSWHREFGGGHCRSRNWPFARVWVRGDGFRRCLSARHPST